MLPADVHRIGGQSGPGWQNSADQYPTACTSTYNHVIAVAKTQHQHEFLSGLDVRA